MPNKKYRIKDKSDEGKRIDVYLNESISDLSRSQIQNLIQRGNVLLNQKYPTKPSYHLRYGDMINIQYILPPPLEIYPEKIPLDIVYQDRYLLVINKPSGMVVHPGAGTTKHTLVNALLYHFPEIKKVGSKTRPGIVHRLDKDTSGLMVVARNIKAYESLKDQFKKRVVEKRYRALVWGRYLRDKGIVSWPIGRHIKNGARMSIRTKRPKKSETRFSVNKVFKEFSLLDIKPITGRTHQIRVHMSASGHPIVGDRRYGKKKNKSTIKSRLFLHAYYLSFIHPKNQKRHEFIISLPNELQNILEKI